jgi:hypothetical protein
MNEYIDHKLASQFKKSIPRLKKRLGIKPLPSGDSTFGVEKNTIRAFRGWDKPLETYRSWARNITENLKRRPPVIDISTPDGFLTWHEQLYGSLQKHWNEHQRSQLPLSHCYKLIDLYIKWLSGHDLQNSKCLNGIIRHANCALDSKILTKLNECYSMALPMYKPSMGHIHNQHTYAFCQYLITEFSRVAGGSRLLFDYWAWKKKTTDRVRGGV